jgi:hypothetical protein
VSILYVSMLLEEELSKFHFKKITLGYLAFKYVVTLLDFCVVLLVIVVSLIML